MMNFKNCSYGPLCILFIMLILGGTLAAQNPPAADSSSFEPAEFPADVSEKFLSSITSNETFSFFSALPLAVPSEIETSVWRRNKADVLAKIRKVEIKFKNIAHAHDSKQISNAAQSDSEEDFQLSLVFDGPKVVVRSDKPRYRDYLGGIRLSQSRQKSWSAILEGAGNTSVLVSIPRSESEEVNAVLLCPCQEQKGKAAGADYSSSPFQAMQISFEPDAHVNAGVQSGFGLGLARARILTSAHIAAGESNQDKIVAKDPTISLGYSEPPQAIQVDFSDKDQLIEGVQVDLELKNGAGYKRRSVVEDSILIKRAQPQIKIAAKLKQSEKLVLPGECLLVLKRALNSESYSKEEPEKLQATPEGIPEDAVADFRESSN